MGIEDLVLIRSIQSDDLDKGFLEVLNNLLQVDIDKEHANKILQKIMSNPLHKIFVAEEEGQNSKNQKKIVVGTITLLVEPKFINGGMIVGYIEDVSVKKGYEGLGIGSQLVTYATNDALLHEGCRKVLLYCSKKNMPFYEKLGYKRDVDTCVMKFEY